MNRNFYSFALVSIGMLFCLANFSCKDDDDPEPMATECQGFVQVGEATVDGQIHGLTVSQLIVTSGFSGDDYVFQFSAINSSCEVLESMNISIEIEKDADLDGTYPILDFFDADLNEAYGNVITQTFNPPGQTLMEMSSGTMEVTKLGVNNYTVKVSAGLVGGGQRSWEVTHQF